MLRAIAETGGGAIAVSDEMLEGAQRELTMRHGIDACPEGGATLAALRELVASGHIRASDSVVLFNTGAGWLYEKP
jgi:threonine synthase